MRDALRQIHLPLWSTWYFLNMYAATCDGGYVSPGLDLSDKSLFGPQGRLAVMDRYILSLTKELAAQVDQQLSSYDLAGACASIREFIDVLTNWYLRTSRSRFVSGEKLAFDTLVTVLRTLTEVMAPLAPLTTEEIWRGLTGGRSVHLTDWPVLPDYVDDVALVSAVDEARAAVSAALSLRKAHQLRVRQPLRKLTVASTEPQALAAFSDLIAEEVNVKQVELLHADESGYTQKQEVALNPKAFSPQVRKATSKLFAAVKSGQWELTEAGVRFPGVVVADQAVELSGEAVNVSTKIEVEDPSLVAATLASGAFVILDTALDEELEAEGWARDLIRVVQDERKAADLLVADTIDLTVLVPAAKAAWTERFADLIGAETNAASVSVVGVDGDEVSVELAKSSI